MRGGSEGTGGVSVYAAAQLAAVPICLKPLSLYDAYDQPRASHVPEAARTGRWDLLEDRPGKPGWIATRAGATMDFRVRFGAIPFLTVAFLRSYAGMCNASLRMNEAAFPGSVRLVGRSVSRPRRCNGYAPTTAAGRTRPSGGALSWASWGRPASASRPTARISCA